MGRPAGVTASAAVAIIGSAFVLLTGGLMVMGMALSPEAIPVGSGPVIVVMTIVVGGFAALGAWTGVALLRLRPWARIATLVFAGFLSVASAIAIVVMSLIPAPPMPDAQQQAAFSFMRPVIVGTYAIPLAIGAWWLVYFNRRGTRAAFSGPYERDEPGGLSVRPLSISIIGWLSIIGGAISVPFALIGFPVFLAGFVMTGWAAVFVYAGIGAVNVYVGWALLKLKEHGRRLMIGWYALTMAHAAYVSLVPSVRARLEDVQRAMPFPAPSAPELPSTSLTVAFMLIGAAIGAVVIWFLVKERSRFSSSPS